MSEKGTPISTRPRLADSGRCLLRACVRWLPPPLLNVCVNSASGIAMMVTLQGFRNSGQPPKKQSTTADPSITFSAAEMRYPERGPARCYFLAAVFFRRSAQRFFIISDNRFRPAALRWPRFWVRILRRDCLLLGTRFEEIASRAARARSIRSLSVFNSETIIAMFNSPPMEGTGFVVSFRPRLEHRH